MKTVPTSTPQTEACRTGASFQHDAAISESPLLRIGELARATGLSLRMLHYYEELGLICPAKRTKGGFRLYTSDQLGLVKRIQQLREVGMELPDIRALFAAERLPNTSTIPALRHQVEQELNRTKSLVSRYMELQDDLDDTLDILCECERRHCSETPGSAACPDCEVVRDLERIPPMFAAAFASAK